MRTGTAVMVVPTLLVLVVAAAPVSGDDIGRPAPAATSRPDWRPHARQVHAKFTGKPNTIGQYGDSITNSRAFFSNMFWGQFKFANEDDKALLARFRQAVPRQCADWKEPRHGNLGGWRIENVLSVIDEVLKADNPEIALVMIGTNDLNGSPDPERNRFAEKLGTLIDKLESNGTVVVLHTIPPKRGKMPAVEAYNKLIRQLASRRELPLIDYYAEVVSRRPNDWDGTLVSADGVHPSFPKEFQQDFTEDGLRNSGYTLRNYLALKMWAEVAQAIGGSATTRPE